MQSTLINTTQSNNPIDTLNSRSKELDPLYFSYKFDVNKFGRDVAIADLDVDEKDMSCWIPIADGRRRDGVGDLLEVEGIVTTRHYLNSIVLFDHGKSIPLPIARARKDPKVPETYSFRIDPVAKTAGLRAYFYQGSPKKDETVDIDSTTAKIDQYEHSKFCEQLFDMVVKGYIGAGSIGYQVLEAEHLPPDYRTGVPQGLHLHKVLMLEGSLVVLPANQDTVGKSLDGIRSVLCKGECCGKSLSPYLVKSLAAYAPPAKSIVSPGYNLKSKDNDQADKPWFEKFRFHLEELAGNDALNQLKIGDVNNKFKADKTPEQAAEELSTQYNLKKSLDSYPSKGKVEVDIEVKEDPEQQCPTGKGGAKDPFEEEQEAAGIFQREPQTEALGESYADVTRGDQGIVRTQYLKSLRKKYKKSHTCNCNGKCPTCSKEESKDLSSTYQTKTQPSDSVEPTKACQILSDGTANGKPLTDKQQGLFGASCNKKDKSVPEFGSKSLTDLRKKYKTVKGLRRRVRKHRPGSSTIYVAGKDLDAVRDSASKKGIKCSLTGEKGNMAKMKLVGHDDAIDELAKEFGKRVKSLTPLTKAATGKSDLEKYKEKYNEEKKNSPVLSQKEVKKEAEEGTPPKKLAKKNDEEWEERYNHREGHDTTDWGRKKEDKKESKSPRSPKKKEDKKQDLTGKRCLAGQTTRTGCIPKDGKKKKKDEKSLAVKSTTPIGVGPEGGGSRERLSISNETLLNSAGGTEERHEESMPVAVKIKANPQGAKNMSSKIVYRSKAANMGAPGGMDPAGTAPPMAPDEDTLSGGTEAGGDHWNKDMDENGEQGPDEPYGAQVLRRVHADLAGLLQEYDSFMDHLEDDSVRERVKKKLETMVEEMEDIESHWSGHERYKELSPLEGGDEVKENLGMVDEEEEMKESPEGEETEEEEGKDLDSADTTAVGVDSGLEEEPTTDEAVEGMTAAEDEEEEEDKEETPEEKSLRLHQVKSLRSRYGKKDWDEEEVHKSWLRKRWKQLGDSEDDMKEKQLLRRQWKSMTDKKKEDKEEEKSLVKIAEDIETEKKSLRNRWKQLGNSSKDLKEKKSLRNRWKSLEEDEKSVLAHKSLQDVLTEKKFLRKRWDEVEESAEGKEEKKWLRKRWQSVDGKEKQLKKDFPHLTTEADQVDVHRPKSPSNYTPGREPLQQFGAPVIGENKPIKKNKNIEGALLPKAPEPKEKPTNVKGSGGKTTGELLTSPPEPTESITNVHESPSSRRVNTDSTHDSTYGREQKSINEGELLPKAPEPKGLTNYDRKHVSRASVFLKDIHGTQSFGEAQRQKAYYHSKQMEGAALGMMGGEEGEEEKSLNLLGSYLKDYPFSQLCEEVDQVEVHKPKGPSSYTPGQEPMQQFGTPVLGEGKDYPFQPLDTATGEVDVHKPKGPNSYNPGKEPMQQFGTPVIGSKDYPEVGKEAGEVNVHDPKGPSKYKPGDEPMQQFGGDLLKQVKTIAHACHFLKDLSEEKAFGEDHRTKALYLHKALEPLAKEPEMAMEAENKDAASAMPEDLASEDIDGSKGIEGGMPFEPGEMDEKQLKDLQDSFALQQKAMQDLNKSMNGLASVLN